MCECALVCVFLCVCVCVSVCVGGGVALDKTKNRSEEISLTFEKVIVHKKSK